MFCPHKNSYLQMVCAMNPRVINKAVNMAMQRGTDERCEYPPAKRLESMQPSLFAPWVDITRAQIGFGRIGLKKLIRELHSVDHLVQLQAIHSVMDQMMISESALFLLDQHVVFRLIDLMSSRNPVIREKMCLILTHTANYYQGRLQIMQKPEIVENLMWYCLRDRKEIRYAAAYTLKTLAHDRCACQFILQNDKIVKSLLKIVINDHTGIVKLHLATMENLFECDPEVPLKLNAFQTMLSLFSNADPDIVANAMNCMSQLCKHSVGRKLADIYDMTNRLRLFLKSVYIEVVISAVQLMQMTTLTTRSKWRAREFCNDLTKQLVHLCSYSNKPLLQLRCMQVLINMCDSPDVRHHMHKFWLDKISSIKIRTHEEWDGTTETTSYGLETGHNYRTMCIEGVETIKNEYGDNSYVVNVHSYLQTVNDYKKRLIKAIKWKSYRD